ncbi:transglycosylase SLT domain-containing protein [Streptomyces sp. NPDC053542]|uniref:aggregation-promoting factor C-terminal-like domain-containing protein n=1 Tax=Streptomyces sp. NPDC053542 TaxID=3365710 RepID=UPI0037CDF71A
MLSPVSSPAGRTASPTVSRKRAAGAAAVGAVALGAAAAAFGASPAHAADRAGAAEAPAGAAQAQAAAHQQIPDARQFQCFSNIVERESGWNPQATNASSGAYGLVQALPGSKMASAGADWKTNPATQVKWGLNYMNERYGSPCGAWSFWQSHNWY